MAYAGCDRPTYYVAKWRKARVLHECLECESLIHPGETYRRTDGHWSAMADSFATCEACALLWDILVDGRTAPVVHGELGSTLAGLHRKEDNRVE